LRAAGCRAHVTVGGHYPSFDYGEVLQRIPGADSVVRFEGEATLVELMERLAKGREWRDILGIAYRRGPEIAANPLRPAIDDLDSLPEPDRADIDYRSRDLATASLLGSRGCPWNCSFCSIRPFYEAQGGRLRRLRAPRAIAEEMRRVHFERGARIFLFQDDDFLATGARARDWAEGLADEILRAGLGGRIAFKISCRSDEVRAPVIERLLAAGLTHVYMGVESGDADGLRHMNKMLKPAQHLAAGEVLRALGLSFDFGFMLLEPYSTLDSTLAMSISSTNSSATGGVWQISAGHCPTQERL
jgi:anaerobic magnesium-protoporphyrin IX monomethyl ester cyclase